VHRPYCPSATLFLSVITILLLKLQFKAGPLLPFPTKTLANSPNFVKILEMFLMNVPAATTSALPTSWQECQLRGWTRLDILLVTGDAYVDHPSYGVALIGRLLLSHGYLVAILAQPRFDTAADFRDFPPPALFCGITAGNLDSIVANYSGNGKVRDTDAYSPDGNPWRGQVRSKSERRRPDRASLLYSSLARSAFPGVPIVLGGIEASLRRFVHYDYKQEQLRSSFLTDAKADLLVYGMGEKAVLAIAAKCRNKEPLSGIAGTCQRLTDRQLADFFPEVGCTPCTNSQPGTELNSVPRDNNNQPETESNSGSRDNQVGARSAPYFRADLKAYRNEKVLVLASWQEILASPSLFLDAEMAIDRHARASSPKLILQRQQSLWLVQHPAPPPLSPEELDGLYSLPFSRRPHPAGQEIPAHRMIKDSVTIVRGCAGNCSFCAITRHQGPAIVSRSRDSIRLECQTIAGMAGFTGTITDLGGPTANLYGTSCAIGSCKKRDCLYPKLCTNLRIDEDLFLGLLEEVGRIDGVRHAFISSGLRMELLLRTPRLLERILSKHTPGALKIAPEHSDDGLLELMHKEPHALLQRFVAACRKIGKKLGKKIELSPYAIISHPGSTPDLAEKLGKDMKELGLQLRQFQDFTPTPGTLSTAMYVTGLRPDSKKPLVVPRNHAERMRERCLVEQSFHRKAMVGAAFRHKKKR
jgi:uncharacterized radical SAM protein YgiQ